MRTFTLSLNLHDNGVYYLSSSHHKNDRDFRVNVAKSVRHGITINMADMRAWHPFDTTTTLPDLIKEDNPLVIIIIFKRNITQCSVFTMREKQRGKSLKNVVQERGSWSKKIVRKSKREYLP